MAKKNIESILNPLRFETQMQTSTSIKKPKTVPASSFRYIPPELIVRNEMNDDYSQSETDIRLKAESFRNVGMMHNIVVVSDGSGRFRLISGEQRYRAAMLLPESERKEIFPNGLPAMVYEQTDAITMELMLREANSLVRTESMEQIIGRLEKIRDLYLKKANDDGADKQAALQAVRDKIKELMDVKDRQATRYMAVLSAPKHIRRAVETGTMDMTTCEHIMSAPEEDQDFLYQLFLKNGKLTKQETKELGEYNKEIKNIHTIISKKKARLPGGGVLTPESIGEPKKSVIQKNIETKEKQVEDIRQKKESYKQQKLAKTGIQPKEKDAGADPYTHLSNAIRKLESDIAKLPVEERERFAQLLRETAARICGK